jgi:hypothetical protein
MLNFVVRDSRLRESNGLDRRIVRGKYNYGSGDALENDNIMTRPFRTLLVTALSLLATLTWRPTAPTIMQYAASLKGLKKRAQDALYQLMKDKKCSTTAVQQCTCMGSVHRPRGRHQRVLQPLQFKKFYFTPTTKGRLGMNIEHSFPRAGGRHSNDAYKDLYTSIPQTRRPTVRRATIPWAW